MSQQNPEVRKLLESAKIFLTNLELIQMDPQAPALYENKYKTPLTRAIFLVRKTIDELEELETGMRKSIRTGPDSSNR